MADDATYHVLLIGIDAYPMKPLFGCVNDIDAVERLLIERAGIAKERIKRVASPHPTAPHQTVLSAVPGTLANLRAAFAELGSERVKEGDRVFIYYSGHGARVPLAGPQGTIYRESLVPVDFNEDPANPRFLFDYELNRLLARIAARTTSVSFILDCCHSAGATRKGLTRSLDFEKDGKIEPLPMPGQQARDLEAAASEERGIQAGVDACLVVAACLNHQLAQEDDQGGVRHGLLTAALMRELETIDKGEIKDVRWARIWPAVRAAVETQNPSQNPWMSGAEGRAVLGGPYEEGDSGFKVTRGRGESEYLIQAGTLVDIEPDTELAVYGEKPAFSPPLDSDEDRATRVSASLLKVVSAKRASAVAEAMGAPFDLPRGARARLVRAGKEAALRCAVVSPDAAETKRLTEQIAPSKLLRVVSAGEAQVRLEQRPDSTWVIADDVSGSKEGYPVLVTMRPDQLDLALSLLELYVLYSRPLRMAARCTDLPGQLQLSLLACPQDGLLPEEAQNATLPEVPAHPSLTYDLKIGDSFCVQVRNRSVRPLKVSLINCAASGKVELCDSQVIEARSVHRFWQASEIGIPFTATEVRGNRRYIDRMLVIGTTVLGKELSELANAIRFDDILSKKITIREVMGQSMTQMVERWTAAQITLGIGMT